MQFPQFDPIALRLGPLAIHWYALAYIAGFLLGWRYALALVRRSVAGIDRELVDDFLSWAIVGVLLGGRIGYVVFYNGSYYLQHPWESFAIWEGGMSFHGGALGVIAALGIFAWAKRIDMRALGDIVVCAVPIGLFFGRLGNFVNGELWGRVAGPDVPWAMVFPTGGPEPRHPSQLYEAGCEGLLLFILLGVLAWATPALRRPGLLSGVFLLGYAVARTGIEQFRQPDAQLGFLALGMTMGQWLSVPMVVAGIALIVVALRAQPRPPAVEAEPAEVIEPAPEKVAAP